MRVSFVRGLVDCSETKHTALSCLRRAIHHADRLLLAIAIIQKAPDAQEKRREKEVTLDLGRIVVTRKTGHEQFHADGTALTFDVLGFWQWSASDLISNATRGRLAEYLVANALEVSTAGIRNEWDTFDLKTTSGIRIEVKSAAYIQSWHQKKLSAVSFITRRTRAWDPDTNVQSLEAKRQADVYVFALLAHSDKATINPLNVKQWHFYVLASAVLDARTRSQHSITLKSLEALSGGTVYFSELREAVERAYGLESARSV